MYIIFTSTNPNCAPTPSLNLNIIWDLSLNDGWMFLSKCCKWESSLKKKTLKWVEKMWHWKRMVFTMVAGGMKSQETKYRRKNKIKCHGERKAEQDEKKEKIFFISSTLLSSLYQQLNSTHSWFSLVETWNRLMVKRWRRIFGWAESVLCIRMNKLNFP